MAQICVEAELSDFECDLAPQWTEWAPQLGIYMDANMHRRMVQTDLDASDLSRTYKVRVTGTPKNPEGIPDTAAIGFLSSCETRNSNGTVVRIDTGTDYVFLKDIVAAGVGFQKRVEFRMRSVKNYLKGAITFTVTKVQLAGCALLKSPLIKDAFSTHDVSQEMMAYIGATIQQGQRLQEHNQALARIHLPAFLGEAGWLLTKDVPLPGAAFALNETPEMNEAFFENSWKQVMLRRNLSPTQEGWNKLSLRSKAEVAIEVTSYVVSSLPYESDEVDRNTRVGRYMQSLKQGCEVFFNSGVFFSGDCEDDGQFNDQVELGIVGTDFPQLPRKPHLVETRAILSQYVPVITLWSVHAASVNDTMNESIGAHANLLFIPVHTFKQMAMRTDPQTAKRLPWPKDSAMMRGLPIRASEGTGMFVSRSDAPLGIVSKSHVYRLPSTARFKKEMPHVVGTPSTFFDHALEGFTSYFYRRGAHHIGLYFTPQGTHRGVAFEDLEKGDLSKLGVLFQERFDDKLLRIMEEAVKIRPPTHPLILSDPESQLTVNENAELVVREVSRVRSAEGVRTEVARMYIHSDDFTRQDAEKLVGDIRADPAIVAVSYHMEPMLDGLAPNIRFDFYVKV